MGSVFFLAAWAVMMGPGPYGECRLLLQNLSTLSGWQSGWMPSQPPFRFHPLLRNFVIITVLPPPDFSLHCPVNSMPFHATIATFIKPLVPYWSSANRITNSETSRIWPETPLYGGLLWLHCPDAVLLPCGKSNNMLPRRVYSRPSHSHA